MFLKYDILSHLGGVFIASELGLVSSLSTIL